VLVVARKASAKTEDPRRGGGGSSKELKSQDRGEDRGLSNFGRFIDQTGTNSKGGRVFASSGGIEQADLDPVVLCGCTRQDDVPILPDASRMSRGEIDDVLQSRGTIIGSFCNSRACLIQGG
jgi:hypothetical protein